MFVLSRCGSPAHDKWICTDSGESSPAPGDSRGQQPRGRCWSDQEGSGSFPGSHLCQVSLDVQVPKARLAQLYCCCLVLITPHYSFNLGLEQGQFQPCDRVIPVTEEEVAMSQFWQDGTLLCLGRGCGRAAGIPCWESQGAPVCSLSRTFPSRLHSSPGAAQHCCTCLLIVSQ